MSIFVYGRHPGTKGRYYTCKYFIYSLSGLIYNTQYTGD